jgi:tetratricopeptide (TPR) repeat protein
MMNEPLMDKEPKGAPLAGRTGLAIGLVLIAASAAFVYSNTLNSPFTLDDKLYIVRNHKLQSLSNLWPPSEGRYMGFLSFALNHHFGGMDPFGYHLVNTIIHILNACLVYSLAKATFGTPRVLASGLKDGDSLAASFAVLASVVFVAHPVQTQAVTYITQRFASLAAFFYLLALVAFVRWRFAKTGRGLILYPAALISAVLAQKTKEISFTLPAVMALYEFTFFDGRERFTRRVLMLAPFFLAAAIIPLQFIGPELGLWEPAANVGDHVRAQQVDEFLTLPRATYLLTQFRVIVTYLRLLVLPIDQNVYYDYPLRDSALDPQVFFSMAFLAALFAFAVYLLLRHRRTGDAYALISAFGINWFFITLSVESSLIPIKDVIFEHRVYLPSVGAALVFSSLVLYLLGRAGKRGVLKASPKAAALVVLLVTATPLSIAAYRRNAVWKDEITLWNDVVKKSYNVSSGHNSLGLAYYNKGLFNDAMREFTVALGLEPDIRSFVYNNIGLTHVAAGDPDKAVEAYRNALAHQSYSPDIYYNLANAYRAKGLLDEAITAYRFALSLRPYDADIIYNLAGVYSARGFFDDALREYKTLLEILPFNPEVRAGLGDAYRGKGLVDEAIAEYDAALGLKPNNAPRILYSLASAYESKGDSDRAVEYYQRLMDAVPAAGEAGKESIRARIRGLKSGRTARPE